MVEAGELSGPVAEATVAASLAALLGERDADGESIFPRPPGATIDTLLLGCTHYPLLGSIIAANAGDRVAIVDSATATASALAELLDVNGLEAPGDASGGAATAVAASAAPGAAAAPRHRQLTTGDAERFAELAGRLFGTDFPDVESVELGVLTA
jgi:glutamate racemase